MWRILELGVFLLFFLPRGVGQGTFNVVYNHTVANGWPDPGGGAGHGVWVLNPGYLVFSDQVATGGYLKAFTHRFDTSGQSIGYVEHYPLTPQHYSFGYEAVADCDPTAICAVVEFDVASDSTNRVLLMRFDGSGDTVSTRVVYDSCFCGPLQTRRWEDDKVLMAGFVAYGGALFACDTGGTLLWERTYPNTRLALSVADLSDQTILLAGQQASGIDNGIWVMRLDSAGNPIWRRDIGGSRFAGKNVSAVQTQDGGIVAACSYMPLPGSPADPQWNYFRKWDIDGNVVWTKQYNEQHYTTSYDLEELPDGDLIVCGGEEAAPSPLPNSRGTLFKLEPDGDLIWLRKYYYYATLSSVHIPYDVEPTSDGGYVLTGYAKQGQGDSLPGMQMVWLLKVDSMGCLVPGCGNIGVEEVALGMENALCVHPNPTGGWLHVEAALPSDLEVHGELQLLLVDRLGRVVKQEVVGKTFTTRELDLSGSPAGVYYLHLRDQSRWLSGTTVVVE